MWQEIIVGICVIAAIISLLVRWLPGTKKAPQCGGCSGCDSRSTECASTSNTTSH